MPLRQQIEHQYNACFDTAPTVIVHSPGRVNLIGEHTDYNEGYVLPAALDLGTLVAARARADGRLRAVALRLEERDEADLADLHPREGPVWTRYVRGVAALLLEAGRDLAGADLLIDGDLPLGGGLSSSASLELGIAVALSTLAGCAIDRRELALLAQRAEHQFAGVQCGIMDQLAVAFGQAGQALLIDCRSLKIEPVPIPDTVRIVVLDSGVPRTLAGSAYNRRRAQCEEAVRWLREVYPEVRALRDVTPEMLQVAVGATHAPPLQGTLLRRARHVVSEDQRVLDSVAALRRGEVAQFGRLMVASHASLRDDYEVSGPELDALTEIAGATPGVLGARLTGAGFGGCAVALAEAERAEEAAASIAARYREAAGRDGQAYVCTPAEGVRVLT